MKKISRNIALVNIAAENEIENSRSSGYKSINSGHSSFTPKLPNELSEPNSVSMSMNTADGKKNCGQKLLFIMTDS